MNEKENPTYYVIIPAKVRYSDITMGAKMLYGEVLALSSKNGNCTASNNYFMRLYGVKKPHTISNWLKELEAAGFVRILTAVTQEGKTRTVWPLVDAKGEPIANAEKTALRNAEKTALNNTSNNITCIHLY